MTTLQTREAPVVAVATRLAAAGVACAAAASIAYAEETADRVAASASIGVVSDYRQRGLTTSDNEAALQAGVEVAVDGGWTFGAFGSSLVPGGDDPDVGIDLYAAKTFDISGVEFGLGATWYHYPNTEDLDYGEAAATLARAFGPADWSVGVNYVWEQTGSGEEANTYVFTNVATPVSKVAGAPLTLSAGLGYEDGAFAVEGRKWDWSLGLAVDIAGLTLSGAYVGTDLDDDIGSDGAVFSISKSF
jgi:uncharacterized protein (TIGR02001 family)